MIEELRPIFATLPPSAMRMELTRLVAGRLELPESLAETLLAGGVARRRRCADARGRSASPAGRAEGGAPAASARRASSARAAPPRAARALSRREETERTFLALCIASPEDGARALQALDPEEHFTSERLRRAAAHLRGGCLPEPMAGIDEQDPELTGVLAELVVQAGRESPLPAMLEVQRMQLELARLDRRIRGASAHRAAARSASSRTAAPRSSARSSRPMSGRWRRPGGREPRSRRPDRYEHLFVFPSDGT